jgi:hypothetical protein
MDMYKQLRGTFNPKKKDPAENLPHADRRILANLRLDRFKTAAFLYRIQKAHSPDCICGELETVEHMILHCRLPHRAQARRAHLHPNSSLSSLLFGCTEDLMRTVNYTRTIYGPGEQ